ncbi:MAG TPA: helix-turn-helix transcriptional regulator [Burkholderiaceae bacterium]|nr:helix-turn-helix transcriptional regulator [Burkholderiaceae bacterium]
MPRKLAPDGAVPTLLQERLTLWGRCIRAQRLSQRITSPELAQRMNISRATLQRLERGDAGASATNYLRAFFVLGLLDEIAPSPSMTLWQAPASRRTVHARSKVVDDDEF